MVEKLGYGGEWGVKTPIAAENDRITT